MKNWKKILLKPDDSLEKAIKTIHKGGARCALVVEENLTLLGIITDGDIRRALIKHLNMNIEVSKIMNNDPVTASKEDPKELIISLMQRRDLLGIPVLHKNVVVDFVTIQNLITKKIKKNPVFLMAGGFGKRLYPLTKEKPKPLLNVGNRPILETILLQFIENGFDNFYISTHFKAEMIQAHFGNGSRWGVDIKYVHESEPLGTAGFLGSLELESDLPIIVMNGDLLTKVNLEELIEYHNSNSCDASICVKEYDYKVPYGVVEIDNLKVKTIEEKPMHKFFINAGIYVLNPKILTMIEPNRFTDMPDLLQKVINKGGCVSSFPIHEYWLDIGHIKEYELAHNDYLKEFS